MSLNSTGHIATKNTASCDFDEDGQALAVWDLPEKKNYFFVFFAACGFSLCKYGFGKCPTHSVKDGPVVVAWYPTIGSCYYTTIAFGYKSCA